MENRSTGRTPFSIVYQRPPLHPLDLIPLPKIPGYSIAAEHLAARVESIQSQVKQQLQLSNAQYKAAKDSHHRAQTFSEGDLVMVHLRKERFRTGTYNKLCKRKVGPCRVLRKINDNAYVVELPPGLHISNTFNVADLSPFYSSDEPLYQSNDSGSSPFQAGANGAAAINEEGGNFTGLQQNGATSITEEGGNFTGQQRAPV
ncbi:hypothetical protein KSP39_PZI020994 [Platanthera zijinensis]|uniref:Tf2-1-like SH3-like domain-containing protein n=1 Tax=Platanthera zijinensis TaxID=2320716 RepID=A0AAP0FVR9_9ASPA